MTFDGWENEMKFCESAIDSDGETQSNASAPIQELSKIEHVRTAQRSNPRD